MGKPHFFEKSCAIGDVFYCAKEKVKVKFFANILSIKKLLYNLLYIMFWNFAFSFLTKGLIVFIYCKPVWEKYRSFCNLSRWKIYGMAKLVWMQRFLWWGWNAKTCAILQRSRTSIWRKTLPRPKRRGAPVHRPKAVSYQLPIFTLGGMVPLLNYMRSYWNGNSRTQSEYCHSGINCS